jgi:DNA-binding NtrC family response regulator
MRPRILIVDDQPEIVQALSVICAAEGFDPVPAHSPKQAVALSEQNLDLVLMDMNYAPEHHSGEEGLQLLQHFHRLEPMLPVIVLTAWVSIPLGGGSDAAWGHGFLAEALE